MALQAMIAIIVFTILLEVLRADFPINNQAHFPTNSNINEWPRLYNTFSGNTSWSNQLTTPWPLLSPRQTHFNSYQSQSNQNIQPWYTSTINPAWIRTRPVQNNQNVWHNNQSPMWTQPTSSPINIPSIPQFPSLGTYRYNSGPEEVSAAILDVQDNELRSFSEQLLDHDFNNAAKFVSINYQGKTTSRSNNDEAPLPLLTVNSNAFTISTINKLLPLHDNYVLQTNITENVTPNEQFEENALLNAVLSTRVMELTESFLRQKGIIQGDFKKILEEIWFTTYPRKGGRLGSSGFEHVFLAEIKKTEISGFHNWLYFNQEEINNKVNYLGYLKILDLQNKGAILKFHFNYHGINKPVGSMFIGTSPEFEMALYSMCFLIRADRVCPLQLAGKRFTIRTFTYTYGKKRLIGSAFPEI